jgi:hypothetical protein
MAGRKISVVAPSTSIMLFLPNRVFYYIQTALGRYFIGIFGNVASRRLALVSRAILIIYRFAAVRHLNLLKVVTLTHNSNISICILFSAVLTEMNGDSSAPHVQTNYSCGGT